MTNKFDKILSNIDNNIKDLTLNLRLYLDQSRIEISYIGYHEVKHGRFYYVYENYSSKEEALKDFLELYEATIIK